MSIEDDRQAQEEEMEILLEVLDSDCFSKYEGATISGQLDVKVRIPGDSLRCKYPSDEDEVGEDENIAGDGAGPSEAKSKKHKILTLEHVPPLTLHFTLPSDYPSNSKPIFTLSSKWLSREALSIFCYKLDELWEENKGMAILFTWHSFLKEDGLASIGFTPETVYDLSPFLQPAQTLQARAPFVPKNVGDSNSSQSEAPEGDKVKKVKISAGTEESTKSCDNSDKVRPKGQRHSRRHGKRTHQEVKLDPRAVCERWPNTLLQYLVDYDKTQTEKDFLQSVHSCAICLSERRGTDCMLFQCQHVFCKDCLKDYFSLHITEGSLDCVKCPDIECKVVPTPNEVKTLVGPELFERYDTLLLSKTLDSMPDVMTCPRVSCGKAVLSDPNDKLAKCASCGYAFCTFCKMVYHGVEPCRFKAAETKLLYEKYTSGTKEEKQRLEKTYGKKQLELLVEQTLSENWVHTQSKPCPHCQVPIQKFEGCNKVTCFKCSTYFCWICASQLDKQNPYLHFNDPTSRCYNNLFANLDGPDQEPDNNVVLQQVDDDDDDDDWDEDEEDFDDYEFDSDTESDEGPAVNFRLAVLRRPHRR